MKKILFIVISIVHLALSGCMSIPKQSIELSEITAQQTTELQKSHIKFVKLYYKKLRDDVNNFIDEKWTPLFLSKAVNHKVFRSDLDDSYLTSSISERDISVSWKGQALKEPQKSIVLNGVKQTITNEKGKLGRVLLDWSQEAQREINKKRKELLSPIEEQERFIIEEINNVYIDLQRSQAAIKGFLASAVELEEKQEQILKKLGALGKLNKVVGTMTDANEKLSEIFQSENGDKVVSKLKEHFNRSKDSIKNASK